MANSIPRAAAWPAWHSGASMTSYLLEGLHPGLNYFAMTAVNSAGLESAPSAVVPVTLY